MNCYSERDCSTMSAKGKKYRSYRNFDNDNFKYDLTHSDLIQNPDTNSATFLYTQYHASMSSMSTLLDKHAPLKSCNVTPSARSVVLNEWITDEISLSERKKRRLKRIWRRDLTDSN